MKCKYCLAEVEENATVCPLCGKELGENAEEATEETVAETVEEVAEETAAETEVAVEETEESEDDYEEIEEDEEDEEPVKKKKSKAGKIVLAVVGVIVLAVALTAGILYSMGLMDEVKDGFRTVVHELNFKRENDVFYHLSYTKKPGAIAKKEDAVVATVGDQKLTVGELQAHYWTLAYDAYRYQDYPEMDITKPLDEQVYDKETGMTYQQMFLEMAVETWHRYAALIELSKENGFTLSEDQQKELDNMPEDLNKMATQNKYDDAEKFIKEQFFSSCSVEGYLQYNRTLYLALTYYQSLYEGLLPTDDEVQTYYNENKATFTEKGIDETAGNYYDVRHILIGPNSGSAAYGDYTDAEWESWRVSAQDILDQFLADNGDEAAFGELAKTKSLDTGSKSDGGLYTKLTSKTNFVENFKNWYLDESRQKGDTGLVKTEHGYHIMYFCGSQPIWKYEGSVMLLSEKVTKALEGAEAKFPLNADYTKVVLGATETEVK